MKKIFLLITFITLSIAGYSQMNTFGGIGLRVNDTTVYQSRAAAFHTAGYYDIYFNNQATNDHWDVWNGSSYDHIFAFGQGSGAVSSVFTRTGAVVAATSDYDAVQVDNTPAGNISATNVQTALNELDTEKASAASVSNVDNTSDANKPVSVAQQAALDLKQAFLVSGTNIKTVNNTSLLGSGDIAITGLAAGSSPLIAGKQGYLFTPQYVLGNGQDDFEISNLGNPGASTEDRNLVNVGLTRGAGSALLYRNVKWNNTDLRWEYDMNTASAWNPGWLEIGGEGVNVMSAPVGTHPYLMPTGGMNFSFRANGLRSVTGYTGGYANQTMSPLVAVYESAASGLGQWNPATNAEPMIHLLSEELKGTSGADNQNEYLRLQSNGTASTIYPSFNFFNGNGTYGTPANISSNKIVGQIGGNAYGGAYRLTAAIQFISEGTITSSIAPQGFRILTSVDNVTNLTEKFRVTNDGLIISKNSPIRYEYTTITTVPSYSTNYVPNITTGTTGNIQQLSTSTGGLFINGFSTTSTAATAHAVFFRGLLGATAPTASAFVFQGGKHNGATSFTDLAAAENLIFFRNNATDVVVINGAGRIGRGQATPTAGIHFAAGTTTASSGPIKLAEGSNPTSAENGLINYVSDNLTFTETSTVYTLAKTLTATATLNFDLTSINSQDLTITVTGAATGDVVAVALDASSVPADITYFGWVSSTNTVTIRCSRVGGGGAVDPTSGTFRASVIKY